MGHAPQASPKKNLQQKKIESNKKRVAKEHSVAEIKIAYMAKVGA